MKGQQEHERASTRGRLLSRPVPPPSDVVAGTGLRPVGLGSTRNGLLYVPAGYGVGERAPLALTLHGAGGDARSGISHFALKRLLDHDYHIDSMRDYGISEVVNIHDPDGNGVELCYDRPAEQWPRIDGQLRMFNKKLEADLLEELREEKVSTA